MALDPLLDASNGASSLPFSALGQVKLHLASLTLHDTWRTINPWENDYKCFSSPHNRYSRLDYLFIHQADLSYLYDATIENMILLDHHPITLTLLFPQRETSTKIWRLDASLLTDPGDLGTIKQTISDYFRQNDTPDVSPMIQWEAHKCVVRSHILAITARKKKEHQTLIRDLSNKITLLEAQHKCSLALKVATELAETRALLLKELFKRARKWQTLSQKLFYEQSNKPC